jgi:D-3-phosphoglycerate dehydrogenase / 2-oxoglutarate reductase
LHVVNLPAIMSSARNINVPQDDLIHQVSRSLGLSTSPAAPIQSTPSSFGYAPPAAASTASKHLKPFATEDIKILLLENVNQTGREILAAQGYQVEFLKTSLPEDQLIQKIR